MIHPDTDIQYIDPKLGFGVFATEFIPQGTIVYVQDRFDIVIPADSPILKDQLYRRQFDKYAVVEPPAKQRILSWDHAKFVNHCCHANILSTGYGFEIAVHDIQAGEELRDDYGMFNLDWDISLQCQYSDCRRQIRPDQIDLQVERWDHLIKVAMLKAAMVPQPLWHLLDIEIERDLNRFLEDGANYRSVRSLIVSRDL